MAVVASITLNNEGHPTSGPGDVLIGDRDEHVANVVRRLAARGEADAQSLAEAIVDAHRIIPVGDPIPAEASQPAPVQAPADASGEESSADPASAGESETGGQGVEK